MKKTVLLIAIAAIVTSCNNKTTPVTTIDSTIIYADTTGIDSVLVNDTLTVDSVK
jgi:hypothetical protein